LRGIQVFAAEGSASVALGAEVVAIVDVLVAPSAGVAVRAASEGGVRWMSRPATSAPISSQVSNRRPFRASERRILHHGSMSFR
jgi:hypothetical protein